MSGIIHQLPFKHYHRKEDGTTYFVMWGQINSAPTCSDMFSCEFDMDASTLIKEWESPAEFEPFRREVEQALGLPITLNAEEKVRDAINAMNCEWKADYDHPGFLAVFPRQGPDTDDKIAWAFGLANGPWGGNDRAAEASVSLCWGHVNGDMHDIAPLRESAGSKDVATAIVRFMRHIALKRVGWLNDFVNSCVSHIEKTSGTSPESVQGQWATVKGAEAYDEARAIIATWKGGRA